jgi:hypothetical protein
MENPIVGEFIQALVVADGDLDYNQGIGFGPPRESDQYFTLSFFINALRVHGQEYW